MRRTVGDLRVRHRCPLPGHPGRGVLGCHIVIAAPSRQFTNHSGWGSWARVCPISQWDQPSLASKVPVVTEGLSGATQPGEEGEGWPSSFLPTEGLLWCILLAACSSHFPPPYGAP